MNYKKYFAFDFECTSREPAQAYMCSIANLDKLEYKEVKTFIKLKDVISYIFKQKNNSYFYAHNLSYDISFILSYMFQNHRDEFLIKKSIIMPLTKNVMEMQIVYNNRTIIFRDSYCLFTAPLSKVMEAYTDLEKTATPLFDYIQDVKIDDYVLKYSKLDALGLAIALTKRFQYGCGALTTASGAFKEFKKSICDKFGADNFNNFFPILNYESQAEMRKAYRGGFTFLHAIFKDNIIENVRQIDVNSMYPHQLYNMPMPYGMPKVIDNGKVIADSIYSLGIQKIILSTAKCKENKIPFLSNTNTFLATNIYRDFITPDESEYDRTFYLTLDELELFKESYTFSNIEYCGGWLFKSRTDLFKPYIDKFWRMKSDKDPTIKALGKLFLNALYGKFAEGYEKTQILVDYEDKIKFISGDMEVREVGYLPVGIFVTSYARCYLIRSIYKIGVLNFVYCDTDSIHFINEPDLSGIEFDESELGKWGWKKPYKRGYYIRAKRYCGEIEDDNGNIKLEVACAGIKKADIYEQVKRLEDFKVGKPIKTIEFKMGVNGKYARDKVINI